MAKREPLTDEECQEIARRYSKRKSTIKVLARELKVRDSVIRDAILSTGGKIRPRGSHTAQESKRLLTPQQHLEVLDLYVAMSAPDIAHRFGVSPGVILDAIRRFGGKTRRTGEANKLSGGKRSLSLRLFPPEKDQEIWELYQGSTPVIRIAEMLSVSRKAITNAIHRAGGELRPHYLPRNENAFENGQVDPTVAYFIGLFMADGCIYQDSRRKYKYLEFGLKKADLECVESFKSFLCSEAKISERPPSNHGGTGQYRIAMICEKMFNDLLTYGVTPRKSTRKAFSADYLSSCTPECLASLFRGLVCGNGTVAKHIREGRNEPCVALHDSRAICEQFRDFCQNIAGGIAPQIRKKESDCYTISYNCYRSVPILHAMFSDRAAPTLSRKQTTADEILDLFDKQELFFTQKGWSREALFRSCSGAKEAYEARGLI